MLERVQCVSLPRSGHNLLVSHLQRYFSSNRICVGSSKKRRSFFGKRTQPVVELANKESLFHYCEYYYACREHPCVDDSNTFQKSHDFELKLPCIPEQKYLVQFRQPLGLLISWFEMRLPRKREVDSADGFIAFLDRNRHYLEGFREKWIDSELPNQLLVDYEDYLSEPASWLARIVEFFDDERKIVWQKLMRS